MAGLSVTIQVTLISFAVSLLPSLPHCNRENLCAPNRSCGPVGARGRGPLDPGGRLGLCSCSSPSVRWDYVQPLLGPSDYTHHHPDRVLLGVFRGALLSIGKGQFEAGYSIGLSTVGVYRRVVLPQAFAVAAPLFASSVIQLVQNSTVASVVGLQDLLRSTLTVQYITASPAVLLPAAGIYLLYLLPVVHLVQRMEERMQKVRVH